MSDTPPPDEIDRLAEGWLDGTLDEVEEHLLGAFVAAAAGSAARLARATLVHARLRDLLRGEGPVVPPPPTRRSWVGAWLALPVSLAALVAVAFFLVRGPEATAAAALERVARVAATGDRAYVIRVLDHGPAGALAVADEAGGRKPGVDGARLWVSGTDRFVLVRRFDDGTDFVNGCDGAIGWSVPPTGHVHLSRDTNRFRRGLPGEGADGPFITLPTNLLRLGRGYDLHLDPPLADGSRRLVADRRERRRRGPSRVTIHFAADGTALAIDLEGLREGLEWKDDAGGSDGPERVSLELVSREPLDPAFFSHDHHHAPDRPLDWE